MLSTAANATDGRFDGDAKSVAGGSFHPSGSSAAIGPLNGVGNGGSKRAFWDSARLYLQPRPSSPPPFGDPSPGTRQPPPPQPLAAPPHPDLSPRPRYQPP